MSRASALAHHRALSQRYYARLLSRLRLESVTATPLQLAMAKLYRTELGDR